MQTVWQRLSDRGDGQPTTVGFDNATYLSELRHADRNFALSYFMKVGDAHSTHIPRMLGVLTCCVLLGRGRVRQVGQQ